MTMHKKLLYFFTFILLSANIAISQNINIHGPAGSERFGRITVLPNGNYVVVDPFYDDGGLVNVGAVNLYNGNTHALISTLKGGNANDIIGYGGIVILTNGNFIVNSLYWGNGTTSHCGAVTLVNGTTGLNAVVNSSNSLVGSHTDDNVGYPYLYPLSNGNYVVGTRYWNNVAGAVTWGNGTTGVTGVVSNSNSLVGEHSTDFISSAGITILSNGNYVVPSPNWHNAANISVGAVTWGNGTTGISGFINSSNSLIGNVDGDFLGTQIVSLTNGNYVIGSPNWDNTAIINAGAATWCNGTTGRTGLITSSNSLIGTVNDDLVSIGGIAALSDGNYVVGSSSWDNGAIADAGAATWCNGTTGATGLVTSTNSLIGNAAGANVANNIKTLNNGNYIVTSIGWDNGPITNVGAITYCTGPTGLTGVVSSSNSLVGSTANDNIGNAGISVLTNGNYVVLSTTWDNGSMVDAGAATWCNGTTGLVASISSSNSLVGGSIDDKIGNAGITILSNGNYVVRSTSFDNGSIADVGAATWGNGTTGTSGVINSSNSLVGTSMNDNISAGLVVALSNGNYVVASPNWDNGVLANAGAATWCNGATGRVGLIDNSNSLIGSTSEDNVGSAVIALTNGNYVVSSFNWDNGALTDAGAATWGNGASGISGVISSSNSLLGSNINDYVSYYGGGNTGITALTNGNYVISSPLWTNNISPYTGAITLANGASGISGTINSCNSVLGDSANGGTLINFKYNYTHNYLIIGRPMDSIVTIYDPNYMALANNGDVTAVNITGLNPVPVISNNACRVIATIIPNAVNPISGIVHARTWIETGVPTSWGQPYVARHYEITPVSNASSATANVKLYFTQQEFTDFNNHPASTLNLPTGSSDATGKANLRIGKYSGTTNNGTGFPASYSGMAEVIDPADVDIIWNNGLSRWEISFNVTGFSGFIVQTNPGVIPLKLLEFNARLAGADALVTWKTTDELNMLSYDVERSTDGRNFSAVGNVVAVNQSAAHLYNFTDKNIVLSGVQLVYYRLKQKDINGRFTYSGIVTISIGHSNNEILFYPNPVVTEASLVVTINKPQQLQARIVDMLGKVVEMRQWKLSNGCSLLTIDVEKLAKGIYTLELTGEDINERNRFIKQ